MSANITTQILIVEDEPAHVEMISHHLQAAGYLHLQTVETLADCLQAIATTPPDIILIDLHLPDGGAMDLLKEVEDQIPVITITSRGSEEQAVEVLKAGALDYLTKSAETFAAMPRIVERALREWQLQRANQQALEKIRQQQVLTGALLQNTATPIFVIDPQHRVLVWNKACEELTGVKAQDVVGTDRHWSGFYPEERPCLADVLLDGSDHTKINSLYAINQSSHLHEEGLQAEKWLYMADKERYLSFNAALVRDESGTIIAAIETLQDITGRKKTEEALLAGKDELQRQHEKLDELFKQVEQAKQEWEETLDCMSDIVILADQQGGILRANRALGELVKRPMSEILGLSWHELLGLSPEAEVDSQRYSREFFHQPTERWFLLSIYPFARWGLTSTADQVVTLNDRTAIKQMTADLEQANSDLKQAHLIQLQSEKMASIGQLAAGVAHEINNPIGFVTSNLGSLEKYLAKLKEFISFQDQELTTQANQETLERVAANRKQLKIDFTLEDIDDLLAESRDGVDRVGKIVRDLKGFSRVDEAEHKLADLIECLESSINIAWNEVKYKATLNRDFAELPQILCFPGQLNQVFVNLLVNAAQAMETQGTIDLKAWADEDAVYIRISDSGCGISAENCQRIFDPFFTTKEVGKGTGLGLSITYDIIKKHQGEIRVESRIGEGTSFTIQLPIRSEERQAL